MRRKELGSGRSVEQWTATRNGCRGCIQREDCERTRSNQPAYGRGHDPTEGIASSVHQDRRTSGISDPRHPVYASQSGRASEITIGSVMNMHGHRSGCGQCFSLLDGGRSLVPDVFLLSRVQTRRIWSISTHPIRSVGGASGFARARFRGKLCVVGQLLSNTNECWPSRRWHRPRVCLLWTWAYCRASRTVGVIACRKGWHVADSQSVGEVARAQGACGAA